ncbi:unnamed protein product [Lupinus luteus]|uniref:Legume lectin domain-containing protein n=1 Tax=Lupinus luteus TaxID=3873 RepID=A0AAV1XLU7_LUPLU
MARAGQKKPKVPLISKNINLSEVLLDETYVGFSAATGKILDSTKILAWSFSNSNFSIGDALLTDNLPSFFRHKGLKAQGGYTIEEAERLLHLGLLCSESDSSIRPNMRQVVKVLERGMEGIEPDEESMEMSLLGKIKSAAMWSKTECTIPYKNHPTLDEIRMFSFSSKTTRSGSVTIPEPESIRGGLYMENSKSTL